jgi:hypothetical protein
MPQENEKLVVPGGERDPEVAGPAAVSNRHAVHEQRAGAHGADTEVAGGRRLVQPEFSREGHGRGLSEARLRGETDPPGSGERVGDTGPRGHGDAREDDKRGGVGEKAAWSSPPGGR